FTTQSFFLNKNDIKKSIAEGNFLTELSYVFLSKSLYKFIVARLTYAEPHSSTTAKRSEHSIYIRGLRTKKESY
ncbi:hypothetical protein, partial [Escherichia coli]|uniref:hypothetical protein n=1 Tax=Escherichia coli TaxID=562 RepID=UPI0021178B4F